MFQVGMQVADNLEYVILKGISNSNLNNKHDEVSPQIIGNKQKQAIISCIIML